MNRRAPRGKENNFVPGEKVAFFRTRAIPRHGSRTKMPGYQVGTFVAMDPGTNGRGVDRNCWRSPPDGRTHLQEQVLEPGPQDSGEEDIAGDDVIAEDFDLPLYPLAPDPEMTEEMPHADRTASVTPSRAVSLDAGPPSTVRQAPVSQDEPPSKVARQTSLTEHVYELLCVDHHDDIVFQPPAGWDGSETLSSRHVGLVSERLLDITAQPDDSSDDDSDGKRIVQEQPGDPNHGCLGQVLNRLSEVERKQLQKE
eukprot:3929766-Amphidinium_carterae.1